MLKSTDASIASAVNTMEEELSQKWVVRFGSGLPEWVGQLHGLQDVDRAIGDCRRRIDEFRKRLEEETFLLDWLESQSGFGTKEAKTPPGQFSSQLEEFRSKNITDSFEFLDKLPECEVTPRGRVNEQVDRADVNLVERVKQKLKSGKYLSLSGIDSVLAQAPIVRKRSLSESCMVQTHEGKYKHKANRKLPTLSPIKDKDLSPKNRYAPYKITTPTKQPASVDITPTPPVATTMAAIEGKRLSNGIHLGMFKVEETEDDDLLASVKTVVDDSNKEFDGKWSESAETLKRGYTGDDFTIGFVPDEKTPTGSLDASGDILEQGLTLNMVDHARSQSFDLPLKLDQVTSFVSRSLDEQEFDAACVNKEDTGSINDLESNSYNNYHDLAESTLTYILRDTIFATSRSNSVSSLTEERLSSSPEPVTPIHVNLRPNSGKRRERNRDAQLLDHFSDDDNNDEERLQQMLAEIQEPYHSSSPSSDQSYSDPSSPTHLVSWDINQVIYQFP